jgi:hypothetical protein
MLNNHSLYLEMSIQAQGCKIPLPATANEAVLEGDRRTLAQVRTERGSFPDAEVRLNAAA